ncbi:hypothetical protein FQN57_006438 [Myotisia sp. PD_48]|nr:hypothetical protein FQN57_006438 [Myotisia sp. PD_48]
MSSALPGEATPLPNGEPAPTLMCGGVQPKLTGKQRFLRGIHRIASSPSLRKGRSRSASLGSKMLGSASISCVSLSSTLSKRYHGGSSNMSPDGEDDGYNVHIRVVETDPKSLNSRLPTSIPLPSGLRPGSRGSPVQPATETADPVEAPKIDFWAKLPVEMVTKIFGYLSTKDLFRCCRVSKGWNKICFDGQIWTHIDTSTYYSDIPADALLKAMLAAGPFLRNLNLRGCVQLSRTWEVKGDKITNLCRKITHLNLDGTAVDEATSRLFFTRNPGLMHINMCGVQSVTNSTIRAISRHCQYLEFLDVSWCKGIEMKGIIPVVESCRHLKDLRLSKISGLENERLMLKLFEANTLERLVLSNCGSLIDSNLQVLIQGLNPRIDILTGRAIVPPRKFKQLDLSNCRLLTDAGVKHLAHNVPELEGLRLSFIRTLSDETVISIIETTPNLRYLELEELGRLTNHTLIELSKAPCAQVLEQLSLSYCEKIGDMGLIPLLQQCPKIRSLDLDNTRISDLTLTEICSQMRKRGFSDHPPQVGLRVAVFDCGGITWSGIYEVLFFNSQLNWDNHLGGQRTSRRNCSALSLVSTPPNNSLLTKELGEFTQSESKSVPMSRTIPLLDYSAIVIDTWGVGKIPNLYPRELIQLKCFYGWQMTVDEHMKRIMRGDFISAQRLGRSWSEYMAASDSAHAAGSSRRVRRRARDLEVRYHLEEDELNEYGTGRVSPLSGRRRRAISGGSCLVM